MKRSLIFLTVLLTAIVLSTVSAAADLPARVTNATNAQGYNSMMDLIDNQSFGSEEARISVKNYIKHYTYFSDYAAYYQKEFPYKNNIGYYNAQNV